MSYTKTATAQERRNALMERILLRKFNVMESEYDKMKNAENRLRIKHEIQARIDRANPEFDPNVKIEYNPQWSTNDNKDTDDEDEDENEAQVDIHPQNNENDKDRICLSENGIDKIKSLMQDMPTLNAPAWANKIPEDVWKQKLLNTLDIDNNDTNVTQTQSKPTQHIESKSIESTQANKKTKPPNQNKSQSKNKHHGKGRNKTKNKGKNKKKNKKSAAKSKNSRHKSKKRTK